MTQRLFIILVVFPLIFLVIYNIIITIQLKDDLKNPCVNEHKQVGTSRLYLNIFIIVTSLYVLYQAYFKQRWDIEIKVEYTVYIITTIICKNIQYENFISF